MLGVVVSPKQVCGDQGLDWGQPLLQSATAELSKPSFMRGQQPRQEQPESLKCPRCGSTNTKFCYYNNYNKSQPRHLCKSCKRHWTNGGTLRKVPVGGARKNKRPRSSTASAMAVVATSTDQGCWKIPVANAGSDQKSVANILYGTLIPSSSPPLQETRDSITFSMTSEPFLGSNGMNTIPGLNESAAAQIPTEEFPFSSLSSFEENAPLINPDSHQSSSHHIDYYSGHLDSMEESTFDAPWPGPSISTGADLPNYWDWNEINVLNSSADLNIAWDDVFAETKT